MKRPIRMALFVFAGLALPAAFVHAFTSWVGGEGWDPRTTGELLVRENQRQQVLERDDLIVAACLAQKHQVTTELLAGRLTLAEAIRHFHTCEAQRDERLGKEVPPLDDSRKAMIARSVLWWVTSLAARTSEGRARLRALEQEYQTEYNAGAAAPDQASG